MAQRMESAVRDVARVCPWRADTKRGLALSMASAAAGRPAGGGQVDRAQSLADAGADGSFSAGLLSPALRSSISKSVDVGGGSRFRFGRVAESIFPVGVIRRSGGWRLTLRSASLGSGTGPGKPGVPKARRS